MSSRFSLRWSAVAAVAALMVAGGGPAAAKPAAPDTPSAVVVEVQTYNMYFGANLTPLFAPDVDVVEAASAIWAEMQASDIPARAKAVAELIADESPDLVGLQEVSTWKSAPAALGEAGIIRTGPFETDYEALDLLLGHLADLGTPYEMVVANTNFSNVTFPLPVVVGPGPQFRLATFTDRDVILVKQKSLKRGQLQVGDVSSYNFAAELSVTVAGEPVSVPRGWSEADVTVRGRTFTFANTHLEAYGFPPLSDQIRNPQAVELGAAVAASTHPVVLVGDVNVRPTMCADYRPGSPQEAGDKNTVAYRTLLAAGLTEVWPMVYPKDPCGPEGWTSGQDSLDGPISTLDHRIDDVFLSDDFSALQARVVGDEQVDRTPGGLWPSDHASTWAKIRLDSANKAN